MPHSGRGGIKSRPQPFTEHQPYTQPQARQKARVSPRSGRGKGVQAACVYMCSFLLPPSLRTSLGFCTTQDLPQNQPLGRQREEENWGSSLPGRGWPAPTPVSCLLSPFATA